MMAKSLFMGAIMLVAALLIIWTLIWFGKQVYNFFDTERQENLRIKKEAEEATEALKETLEQVKSK